jgi:hypothetical protein
MPAADNSSDVSSPWVVVIGWQTRVSTPPRLTAFFPIVKRLVAKLIPFVA